MKQIAYLLFIFSFTLLASDLYSPDGIAPTQPRLRDIKQQKKGTMANCIQLKYRGQQADYAIFYDLNGDELYIKYRRNKFDKRAESLVKNLIPGLAYLVAGEWLGSYIFTEKQTDLYPPRYYSKTELKNKPELVQNKNNVPVYRPLSVHTCQGNFKKSLRAMQKGHKSKFYTPLFTAEIMY